MLGHGLSPSSRCEHCEGGLDSGHRLLGAGDVVTAEGARSDYVFPLIEGFLKEEIHLPDGRKQLVRLLAPGEIAGFEALSTSTYQTTTSALCSARVCVVPTTELIDRAPAQADAIRQALIEQIGVLKTSLVRLGAMSAEERVRDTIARFLQGAGKDEWVHLPLSRDELAELLGLSVGTISRALQKMAKEGSIAVSGRRVKATTLD